MEIISVISPIIFIILFLLVKKSKDDLELYSWICYSFVAVMACLGVISLFLSFSHAVLDINKLNIFIFLFCLIIIIFCFRKKNKKLIINFQAYTCNNKILFSQLSSLVFSTIFALIFFTPDLIPSSMTGDPARHFQSLFDLNGGVIAFSYKPIYRVAGSYFIYFFDGILDKDKTFILFNILIFGIANNIYGILFLKIVPNAKKRYIILCSLLTSSGYSYFSLQYGYYTLLLSSVFLFTVITLGIEFIKGSSITIYFIISLFMCAIALTHSYLLPEAFAMLVYFTLWWGNKNGLKTLSIFKKYGLFWIIIVFVGFCANIRRVSTLSEVLVQRGYVNDDVIFTLSIFLVLAIMYLILTKSETISQAISIFLYCGTIFTISMFFLKLARICAPYYVNRNLIFLLPISTVLTLAFIQKIELKFNFIANLLLGGYYLFIIIIYLIVDYEPLSKGNTKFSTLKDDNQIIHYENAINASRSPLQMTQKDRNDFTRIRSHKVFYFGKNIENIPVLGSDHETIWFSIYTEIYPSLFERADGFVNPKLYSENYYLWKNDPEKRFIVVIKHNNFLREDDIKYIESHCKLVIEGDSYKIMEKITYSEL